MNHKKRAVRITEKDHFNGAVACSAADHAPFVAADLTHLKEF
ncbi:MAG TPA: hypothetical protein VG269_15245 [Tepidisphaeraceae bacterium]|jgi:hypothetical protein|nr:hypothetical protein [Tepidisphaeraceae bacterium]